MEAATTGETPPIEEHLAEIIDDFLKTACQQCDSLENVLLQLCQVQDGQVLIQDAYRYVHNIKTNSAFLGFDQLQELSLHMGHVLDASLKSHGGHSPIMAVELLSALQPMRVILAYISEHKREGKHRLEQQIEKLRTLASLQASNRVTNGYMRIGDILQELGRISPEQIREALELQRMGDHRRLGDILVSLGKLEAEDLQEARELQRRHSSRVLRVGSVDLLRLQYFAEKIRQSWEALRAGLTTVDALDDTLQSALEQILTGLDAIHMRPIKVLWGRAALHTHRLAASNGMHITVKIQGEEELLLDDDPFDKLQDAVLQLCSNAVAHAFEDAEERLAAGKPASGTLRLTARRMDGDVALVEIEDDGRGISLSSIERRAQQMSPAPQGKPSLDWIFLPGFSTDATANNLSGRGVGMDVIRNSLEELSGTITVSSHVGVGTHFAIRFPL